MIDEGNLTKADLAEDLADAFGFSKRESAELVDKFFEQVSEVLISGECVKISGFGNFELRDKSARPGRNPRTGEEVEVEARRVVTFKPGQKLRALVDNHG